jgi:pseudouridine kinase
MPDPAANRTVCCLGGMTMDLMLTLHGPGNPGTFNPVTSRKQPGGTASNVARRLARLSVPAKLVAIVGDDQDGRAIVLDAAQQGVDTGLVQKSLSRPTGSSVAVIGLDGELFAGFADMHVCESMDRAFIHNRWIQISHSTLVFADANLPTDSLTYLIAGCREHSLPLVVDAVSTVTARKLPLSLHGVDLLICNVDEARAILGDELAKDPGSMATALCQRGAASTLVASDSDLAFAHASGSQSLPAEKPLPLHTAASRAAFIAGLLRGRLPGNDWAACLQVGLKEARDSAEQE